MHIEDEKPAPSSTELTKLWIDDQSKQVLGSDSIKVVFPHYKGNRHGNIVSLRLERVIVGNHLFYQPLRGRIYRLTGVFVNEQKNKATIAFETADETPDYASFDISKSPLRIQFEPIK